MIARKGGARGSRFGRDDWDGARKGWESGQTSASGERPFRHSQGSRGSGSKAGEDGISSTLRNEQQSRAGSTR